MSRTASLGLALLLAAPAAAAPEFLATALKNPKAVAVADGKVFVADAGKAGQDGDGEVLILSDGRAKTFAAGFDDPTGMVAFQQWLFIADKGRVRRLNVKTGKADVVAEAKAFPGAPQTMGGSLVADQFGVLYLCGYGATNEWAIYRLDPRQQFKPTVVTESKALPALKRPTGLALDSRFHLLVIDHETGDMTRIRVTDGAAEKAAEGLSLGGAMAYDAYGRLFAVSMTNTETARILGIPRPDETPVALTHELRRPGHITADPAGGRLYVTDTVAGAVLAIPAQIPGWEVDETPFRITTEVAFPNLTWTDWDNGADSGRVIPHRPILLTHAGDGSNRIFVPTQHGVVHVFPNDPKATATKVFLDIQPKAFYADTENEQGLLGLAFHPKYKQNGEFFAFYTDKKNKRENVISRFRVSKSDPDKADPASEEEIFRITRPYWNHDGGTICFGPDGFLYVVLGDGGLGNDPHDNGQNKTVLLGKILRLDVDKKADGKGYAIPVDNPFVNEKDAKPEIYAYGVRNPWRMSFDRKTGRGWMADVGQELWEEIDILAPGGNYGWRRREGQHPFGTDGISSPKGFVEPIWEYNHTIGKSITGGHVYRGNQFPELDGHYLYADYVTGKVWALKYDDAKKRVVANRPLKPHRAAAVMSFGEDETGEQYLMTYDNNGKGLFRLVKE